MYHPTSCEQGAQRHLPRVAADVLQANYALYILTVSRMAWDPRTRGCVAKRRAEGKSTKEIIRCIKRHIARDLYRLLVPL